jgi:hypothetical protein
MNEFRLFPIAPRRSLTRPTPSTSSSGPSPLFHAADLRAGRRIRDQISPPLQCPARSRPHRHAPRAALDCHPTHHFRWSFFSGAPKSSSTSIARPATRSTSTSSASSGCGKSSTPAAAARSTSFTSPSISRCGCSSRRRMSFTAFSSLPFASNRMPSPAAMPSSWFQA